MDSEAARLATLKRYGVLDTASEDRFDRLTKLATVLFDVPIALMSLVDDQRQWFKSVCGLGATETPRDQAFCAHTLDMGRHAVLVVEDALEDDRFFQNPLVQGEPHIRFYAGAALTTPDGYNLGTLCIIDRKPRPRPTDEEIEQLKTLAAIAVDELELVRGARSVAERGRLLELAEGMSGVGHWSYDLSDGQVDWSPELYQIHGLDPEYFDPNLGSAISFYHPDDRPVIMALIDRAVAEGVDYDIRLRIYRTDGELRHVQARAVCDRDELGRTKRIFGVFADVTEQVLTLAAVEEKARRATVAEQIAGLGHWRVDYPSQKLTWSDQMYVIYGLDPATPLETETVLKMVHPQDRPLAEDRLQRDLSGDHEGERPFIRIIRPDGDVRWAVGDTTVERHPDGEVAALVGTLTDITRQKLAEVALAESESRFRLLAENSSDMIVTSSLAGRTSYVSPAGVRLTGYDVKEITGVRTLDLVHPDDEPIMVDAFRGLLAGRSPTRLRWRGRHKSGDWIWFESMPALLLDKSSADPIGFIDVVRDVTTQCLQEDELREARAAAESAAAVKTEFLANVSHELRTPLTSILGFSDMLCERVQGDAEGERYLDRVRGASRALLAIVNDILDFSKLEAGQFKIERRPSQPSVLFQDALQLLAPQAAAKTLTLQFDPARDIPAYLMMDGARVRQIVLNLVNNAVKFTEVGSIQVRLSYTWGKLRCEVVDTGPGVPPDRLDCLFQRFSQVDASTTRLHGGTGLGLAISKGLVEAMEGTIGAESRVGEGSRFWFEVPCDALEDAIGPTPDLSALTTVGGLEGLRVLVADDNPMNRELTRVLLGSAQVEVTVVSSGQEAIDAASEAPFDVILLDIRMPGKDGLSSAKEIRDGEGPNDQTPIVAFSADASDNADGSYPVELFDDRVQKPIVAQELFEVLGRLGHGGRSACTNVGRRLRQ